jgi:hypothetical protein
MTAGDVARLLCALVRLRCDVSGSWLQRLALLVETRSALFSVADHALIRRAWLQLGSKGGRKGAGSKGRGRKATGARAAAGRTVNAKGLMKKVERERIYNRAVIPFP